MECGSLLGQVRVFVVSGVISYYILELFKSIKCCFLGAQQVKAFTTGLMAGFDPQSSRDW